MRSVRRPRLAVAALAGTLILAACGDASDGDDSSGQAVAVEGADSEDGGQATTAEDGGQGTEESAEAAQATAAAVPGVDLGGEALNPASDVPTNLFPDLVVDDVTRAKKVNLRNLIPSEKPVLLWMYAPH